MMHIGVDLEQFVTDPQSSGIQRVLQQLAREWPSERANADFVVPDGGQFLLLSTQQADSLLSLAFTTHDGDQLRKAVSERMVVLAQEAPRIDDSRLIPLFDYWLLPEVTYLPSVLQRFERFTGHMPTSMIGFDVLPMSEPANYRLTPGVAAFASEYFRLLATADSVVCISEHTRDEVWDKLRRDRDLPISVAHPGGDHIPVTEAGPRREGPTRFLRIGTLEARKMPIEIADAFVQARRGGLDAELIFVGRPSASESSINEHIRRTCESESGIVWIEDADDHHVARQIHEADVFLSFGVEGYGIPVLEAIRMGTPVLFAGVQPAAELMVGRGAARLDDLSPQEIEAAFHTLSAPIERKRLSGSIDAQGVPTWSEFARGVLDGVLEA